MKNIIFDTKEEYLEMIQAWKDSCKDKSFQFGAEHYALYAIIRDKDPAKCFASPEQQSKKKLVSQGKHGNEAYNHAMKVIEGKYSYYDVLAPFQGKLTQYQLDLIRERMKELS